MFRVEADVSIPAESGVTSILLVKGLNFRFRVSIPAESGVTSIKFDEKVFRVPGLNPR